MSRNYPSWEEVLQFGQRQSDLLHRFFIPALDSACFLLPELSSQFLLVFSS
jgi:hypothetical protein